MMLSWYIAQITPGYEKKTKLWLEEIPVHVFLPMVEETVAKRGAKVAGSMLLMPGYLFVQFDKVQRGHWAGVVGTFGVFKLLPATLWPMKVSDEYVTELQKKVLAAADSGYLPGEEPWLNQVGKYIRVPEGPFTSFGGRCTEANMFEIKVEVNIFGRLTPVTLPQGSLSKDDVFDEDPSSEEHVVKTKALGYTGRRQKAPLAQSREIPGKTLKR